jgi:ABC-type metal ion transport system, periplasmic component/surface antigen
MRKTILSKKLIAAVGAVVLTVGSLAGCGASGVSPSTEGAESTTANTVEESTSVSEEEVLITIGATPTPHAEVLNAALPILAEKGIKLEIIEFTDYIAPNNAVDGGDLDANFFQHGPYLENFNAENGTNLVAAGYTHYEPLGIYAGKSSDLENILDGASIAVPNDPTNGARALLLLEANGIIKLREGVGLEATKQDIAENPKNIDIVELEAAQVSRVIGEVDFVVLNGNYALLAGLNVSEDAIAKEEKDSDAAKTYANLVAVKEGRENEEAIKTLIEVLTGEEIKAFIEATYEGAVLPIN